MTHVTFLKATLETLEYIREGEYTLILDESLDVVIEFNKISSVENDCRQKMSPADIRLLMERGVIEVGKDYRVIWRGGEHQEDSDFKFQEVEHFAKLGQLYCVRGQLFVTVFPPEMFRLFNEVYVLTYLFGGSALKYYFDLFELGYEKFSVSRNEEEYKLVPYSPELEYPFRERCRELIDICENDALNDNGTYSKSWYQNAKDDKLRALRGSLTYYFSVIARGAKASNGDIMWTCPRDYEKTLEGRGYTQIRQMTAAERRLPEKEREAIRADTRCFVPCNAKATNKYRNRWALAYCMNMYWNPMIEGFFTDGNDERVQRELPPIRPDKDLYALSCLIQWIFRSRVRDGFPIKLFLPSRRMRKLLTDWLECRI